MKKTEEKRIALLKAYDEKIQSLSMTCKKLGISRTTAYNWLIEDCIELNKRHAGCRSKSGRFARDNGVSLPTARKYIAAQERFEKEGVIDAEGLREIGVGKNAQQKVLETLEDIGLGFKEMFLEYKGQKLKLTVEQVIEVFKDPINSLRRILK